MAPSLPQVWRTICADRVSDLPALHSLSPLVRPVPSQGTTISGLMFFGNPYMPVSALPGFSIQRHWEISDFSIPPPILLGP